MYIIGIKGNCVQFDKSVKKLSVISVLKLDKVNICYRMCFYFDKIYYRTNFHI